MEFFYININEYSSIDLALRAIYLFLQKNIYFDHTLVVLGDTLTEDDKTQFSRLYHNTQFQPLSTDIKSDWCKLSDYDSNLLTESIERNSKIAEEYDRWENFYLFEEDKLFPKHFEDADKHIVFTCAKGENKYIIEWLEHYFTLGFDKIIICDNNDDDSLGALLEDYVSRGAVEIFNCHGMNSFQEKMFHMFCQEGNYKWCAYFDCDEFLELGPYANVKEYLATKDDDCLAFNWVIFGSDGHINEEQGKLSERFTTPYLPLLNIYNGFLKAVIRGGRFRFRDVKFSGGHLPYPLDESERKKTYNIGGYFTTNIAPYQTSYPLRYKEGYIKHYYTKSFEEWVDKAKRGWPLNTDSLPYYRYFLLKDYANIKKDLYEKNLFLSDDWFAVNTKEALDFLKDHPVIELARERVSLYAFVSYILFIMSRTTDKTILVLDKTIDDFLYDTLLEYAFVTKNRIIYCKSDDDVNNAFTKYKKPTDSVYFWKVM